MKPFVWQVSLRQAIHTIDAVVFYSDKQGCKDRPHSTVDRSRPGNCFADYYPRLISFEIYRGGGSVEVVNVPWIAVQNTEG